MAAKTLDEQGKDLLFREARTHTAWQDRKVDDETLKAFYDLMKFGPTSANTCPARIVFVKTKEAKERLKPHLDAGNVDKTMSAPVTAIIGYDYKFYEHMDKLAPHNPASRGWFEGNEALIKSTAFRNGSLQGAYLILAARAVGLDCGPMSGFNIDGVKKEFFAGNDVHPNFLCNLGYGEASKIHPRAPRFTFDEVCKII